MLLPQLTPQRQLLGQYLDKIAVQSPYFALTELHFLLFLMPNKHQFLSIFTQKFRHSLKLELR